MLVFVGKIFRKFNLLSKEEYENVSHNEAEINDVYYYILLSILTYLPRSISANTFRWFTKVE